MWSPFTHLNLKNVAFGIDTGELATISCPYVVVPHELCPPLTETHNTPHLDRVHHRLSDCRAQKPT